MKVLLQHARTQLYLRCLGIWTADPGEAYDFHHSRRAIDFARDHSITGVQIALKFLHEEFGEVLTIPVPAAAPGRFGGLIGTRLMSHPPTSAVAASGKASLPLSVRREFPRPRGSQNPPREWSSDRDTRD